MKEDCERKDSSSSDNEEAVDHSKIMLEENKFEDPQSVQASPNVIGGNETSQGKDALTVFAKNQSLIVAEKPIPLNPEE